MNIQVLLFPLRHHCGQAWLFLVEQTQVGWRQIGDSFLCVAVSA